MKFDERNSVEEVGFSSELNNHASMSMSMLILNSQRDE